MKSKSIILFVLMLLAVIALSRADDFATGLTFYTNGPVLVTGADFVNTNTHPVFLLVHDASDTNIMTLKTNLSSYTIGPIGGDAEPVPVITTNWARTKSWLIPALSQGSYPLTNKFINGIVIDVSDPVTLGMHTLGLTNR